MKTQKEIEDVLEKVDTSNPKYFGMTYEQGIEEALSWVLGYLDDDEFSPVSDAK